MVENLLGPLIVNSLGTASVCYTFGYRILHGRGNNCLFTLRDGSVCFREKSINGDLKPHVECWLREAVHREVVLKAKYLMVSMRVCELHQ